MFAEAIPGAILQLAAILSEDGTASSIAITSLIVSALTTGFISASISFDWDTDPKKRLVNPEFYGYIPNRASRRAGETKMNSNAKNYFNSFYSDDSMFCSCFRVDAFAQRSHVNCEGFSSRYVGACVATCCFTIRVL